MGLVTLGGTAQDHIALSTELSSCKLLDSGVFHNVNHFNLRTA